MSYKTVEKTIVKKVQVTICDICDKEILPGIDPWSEEGSTGLRSGDVSYEFHNQCLLDKLKDSLIDRNDKAITQA